MLGISNITSGHYSGSGLTLVTSGRLGSEPEVEAVVDNTVGGPITGPAPLVERPRGHYPVRSLLQEEALLLIPKVILLRIQRKLRVQKRLDTVILSSPDSTLYREINLTDWACFLDILRMTTTVDSVQGVIVGRLTEVELNEYLQPAIEACWPSFGTQIEGVAALTATAEVFAAELTSFSTAFSSAFNRVTP